MFAELDDDGGMPHEVFVGAGFGAPGVGEVFAEEDEVAGGEGLHGITDEAAAMTGEDEGQFKFGVRQVPEEARIPGDGEALDEEGVEAVGIDLFNDGPHVQNSISFVLSCRGNCCGIAPYFLQSIFLCT